MMEQRKTSVVKVDKTADNKIAAELSAGKPATGSSTMPAIVRTPMLARPWTGFTNSLKNIFNGNAQEKPEVSLTLDERAAGRRRNVLLALVALSTVIVTTILYKAQPRYEYPFLQWLQIGLFALLFAWVSAGCITAVMGFMVLLRGDQHALSKRSAGIRPLSPDARTAVIMPICNEDVATVFAGLRATCESLASTSESENFDIFILSDSNDPAVIEAERAAWSALCGTLGSKRIFYRLRKVRTRRKAGNVADFCRRWGSNYRYMIVLDADSVMSGDCLVTLARLMEAHPTAGIMQTAPQACGHATLHARAQQFAARVTGRLFTAGMQYWQLGEAHYWGHNAIIRVEPFMKYCALAPIMGEGSLSGHILSHDFVEAALMRRAGYKVWLVHDLSGSYEQQPPHLLAELQRDRRWCQGNLQNARLIAEPGLHAVHRGMLATGAMAYLSAPLWLTYVALGVMLWLMGGNVFFTPEGDLSLRVMCLWASTITMLILPRLLGMLSVALKGEQNLYGGSFQLIKSTVLEAGLSTLQAPLRMVAHTIFVIGALTGWKLEWKSPPRQATEVSWREAARSFGAMNAVILGLAAVLAWVHPPALIWLSPVGLPLLLAIPVTVLTSRSGLGERLRANGFLLVAEELWTPSVLRKAWAYTIAQARLSA